MRDRLGLIYDRIYGYKVYDYDKDWPAYRRLIRHGQDWNGLNGFFGGSKKAREREKVVGASLSCGKIETSRLGCKKNVDSILVSLNRARTTKLHASARQR